MSDERLMEGMRLTLDAYEEGKLDALREFESFLRELMDAVHDRIARIESHRTGDE